MIPNFTSAYTQQVSKPTGIAEMLSRTGQTIGSGLKSYGMQKQKMDLLDAEKQEEAQLKQASLLFGRIIDQADDAEALAIFDQAYKNGVFDDDDRADFLNRDGSVDRGAMADFVISSGYKDILPASYMNSSKTRGRIIEGVNENDELAFFQDTPEGIVEVQGFRPPRDAISDIKYQEWLRKRQQEGDIDAENIGKTTDAKANQEAEIEKRKQDAKNKAAQREAYLAQGRAARDMLPKTRQLIALNNLIRTGGYANAKKAITDFFGYTPENEGLFSAKAGELVLANIRALGANPTEGERAFLEKITPSISQGGAVNNAILQDMIEIQKRQIKRAEWLTENPNKSIDDYFLENKLKDFESKNKIDSGSNPSPTVIRFDAQGNMIP